MAGYEGYAEGGEVVSLRRLVLLCGSASPNPELDDHRHLQTTMLRLVAHHEVGEDCIRSITVSCLSLVSLRLSSPLEPSPSLLLFLRRSPTPCREILEKSARKAEDPRH